MNKVIYDIKELSKNFHSNGKIINLFKNASFKITQGQLISLVGPSGSGKSTLLHILAMLQKPSKGKIKFMGKDVKNLIDNDKDEFRRNNISIIFQNNNLLTDFTVLENVAIPLMIKGLETSKSKLKAQEMLKAVNLNNRSEYMPSNLSGGEQQRVAIARSLVAETDLILADEPTGNLDRNTSLEVFNYFKKLKKLKKAVVFATHNRELADKADYKLSIINGIIKKG